MKGVQVRTRLFPGWKKILMFGVFAAAICCPGTSDASRDQLGPTRARLNKLHDCLWPDGLYSTDGATYAFSTEAAVSPAGIFLVADSQTLPDGSNADGGWVADDEGAGRNDDAGAAAESKAGGGGGDEIDGAASLADAHVGSGDGEGLGAELVGKDNT